MEDTIIVRGSMPVQKCNSNKEVATIDSLPVALSDEDYTRLQQILQHIEELKNQASGSENWMQNAEADYVQTRNRLDEAERMSVNAIAAANASEKTFAAMDGRVETIHTQVMSQQIHASELQKQLFAAHESLIGIEKSFMTLSEKVNNLENRMANNEERTARELWDKVEDICSKFANLKPLLEEREKRATKEMLSIVDDMDRCFEKRLKKFEKELMNKIQGKYEELLKGQIALRLDLDGMKDIIKTCQENRCIRQQPSPFQEPKRSNDGEEMDVVNENPAECLNNEGDTVEVSVMEEQATASNTGIQDNGHSRGASNSSNENGSTQNPLKTKSSLSLGSATMAGGQTRHQQPRQQTEKVKKPFNPPRGPKGWTPREMENPNRKTGNNRKNSKGYYNHLQNHGFSNRTGNFPRPQLPNHELKNQRLKKLENDIVQLKADIAQREKALHDNTKKTRHERQNTVDNSSQWHTVNHRRRKYGPAHSHKSKGGTWTRKLTGKFKLVIQAADDGDENDLARIQEMIEQDRANKTLLSQISTFGNFAFEYRDRGLVHHNHRGGLLYSVETPQEATRCINLGIWITGRKHKVREFEKAKSDDMCTHCSAWGHLERSCRFGLNGKCAVCSGNHRTESHNLMANKKGKSKLCCPNCSGNHIAYDDSCPAKQSATTRSKKNEKESQSWRGSKGKSERNRGATHTCGHSRRHD